MDPARPTDTATDEGTDRRSLLKKAAVSGALLAVAPTVLSATAASAASPIPCRPVITGVEIGVKGIVTARLQSTHSVSYVYEHLNYEFVPAFVCLQGSAKCPDQDTPTYLSKTWDVESDAMALGGKAIGVQAFATGTPPSNYATTPIPANADEISVISTSDRTLYDLLRSTTNIAVTLKVVADCAGTQRCFGQTFTLSWDEGPTNKPGHWTPVSYVDVIC